MPLMPRSRPRPLIADAADRSNQLRRPRPSAPGAGGRSRCRRRAASETDPRPRPDRGFPIDPPRAARRRPAASSTRLSRTCRNIFCRLGASTDIASRSTHEPADAQRSARALPAEHVAHADDELLQVKRLRQILVGADLEAFEAVLGGVERRHEHHGRRGLLAICRARPKPDPSGSFTSTIARSQAPRRDLAPSRLRPSAPTSRSAARCSRRSASVRPSDASSSTSSTRGITARPAAPARP